MKPIDLFRETVGASDMLAKHPAVIKFQLIGSAIYHPDPKDLDFLVLSRGVGFLVEEKGHDFFDEPQAPRWAFGPEWDVCKGEYDTVNDTWGALRLGNVNLIVTTDAAWYERAALANEVCVALKLMDKPDRMKVYRIVRDGATAETA